MGRRKSDSALFPVGGDAKVVAAVAEVKAAKYQLLVSWSNNDQWGCAGGNASAGAPRPAGHHRSAGGQRHHAGFARAHVRNFHLPKNAAGGALVVLTGAGERAFIGGADTKGLA